MKTLRHNKGATNIITTVIVVGGSLVTAFLTAFSTSSNAIETVKGDIRVVSTTENLHYAEVQKQLEGMDKKLDAIIKNSK